MTHERYLFLHNNRDAKLTKQEISEGWHFCPDWDDMLIHPKWSEAEACTCNQTTGTR